MDAVHQPPPAWCAWSTCLHEVQRWLHACWPCRPPLPRPPLTWLAGCPLAPAPAPQVGGGGGRARGLRRRRGGVPPGVVRRGGPGGAGGGQGVRLAVRRAPAGRCCSIAGVGAGAGAGGHAYSRAGPHATQPRPVSALLHSTARVGLESPATCSPAARRGSLPWPLRAPSRASRAPPAQARPSTRRRAPRPRAAPLAPASLPAAPLRCTTSRWPVAGSTAVRRRMDGWAAGRQEGSSLGAWRYLAFWALVCVASAAGHVRSKWQEYG